MWDVVRGGPEVVVQGKGDLLGEEGVDPRPITAAGRRATAATADYAHSSHNPAALRTGLCHKAHNTRERAGCGEVQSTRLQERWGSCCCLRRPSLVLQVCAPTRLLVLGDLSSPKDSLGARFPDVQDMFAFRQREQSRLDVIDRLDTGSTTSSKATFSVAPLNLDTFQQRCQSAL